jgi:hypothetical protein
MGMMYYFVTAQSTVLENGALRPGYKELTLKCPNIKPALCIQWNTQQLNYQSTGIFGNFSLMSDMVSMLCSAALKEYNGLMVEWF